MKLRRDGALLGYVGSSTPYSNLPRFRELCPELVTAELVDCGHYFPLEVPEQLHPAVRRFLDGALDTDPG